MEMMKRAHRLRRGWATTGLVLGSLLLSVSAPAADRWATVVNNDAAPALKIEATPSRGGEPVVLDTAGPLQGGRTAAVTWDSETGTCLYDLTVTYAERPPLRITGWNVCESPRISIGEAWRRGQRAPQTKTGSRSALPL